MAKFTRRRLLATAAPLAAAPALVKLAGSDAQAAHDHSRHMAHHTGHAGQGHAAMIGPAVPAVGGPNDLDALLYPPKALPYKPGRVREYDLRAVDRELEIAPGVFFPAWTYNGTVPGPVIRATEDDLLRVHFTNAGSHPHTIHFHGIHPPNMDGVFEVVEPGHKLDVRIPGTAGGLPPLPLSRHTAQEAHPQRPLRRFHHRSQGAATAGAGAGHGDERL